MKYIALLRGINVGGNTLIKMVELKAAFEKCGYTCVSTYINSGNVIFESSEKDINKIILHLEKELSKTFSYNLRLVVRSLKELQGVVADVPKDWIKKNDLRMYVAFIKEPVKAEDIAKEFEIKEGVDSIQVGEHVIYMSTKMEGLTKSRFSKLAGKNFYKRSLQGTHYKKIIYEPYQDMTIRNFNTVGKILGIMEKD
jgi:uncharacterized protein (DUF1697 family)